MYKSEATFHIGHGWYQDSCHDVHVCCAHMLPLSNELVATSFILFQIITIKNNNNNKKILFSQVVTIFVYFHMMDAHIRYNKKCQGIFCFIKA